MLEKLQSYASNLLGANLIFGTEKEQLYVSDVSTMVEFIMSHKIDSERDIEVFSSYVGDFMQTLLAINQNQRPIEDFKVAYDRVANKFAEVLKANEASLFVRLAGSSMSYENELKKLEDFNKQSLNIAEAGKHEIEQFISFTKAKIAEIGVKEYEQVFGKESREFEISAWLWLTGLLVALAALIVIGIWYLPQIPDGANGGKIAEIIFRKIVLITGLFYLIALCSRNYRASKHNALVNKHRQNALKTFQIFIKSVQEDDSQTKNAVLLKATETIFGNQPSGFLPDSGDGDMSPKIIEIFKSFPTSAGK